MSKIRYELENGEIQLIDIPQKLINKMKKDSYNQALEDFAKKLKDDWSYKESEISDRVIERIKKSLIK